MVATLIVAFVAIALIQTILFSKLAEHRTDIGRGEHPGAGTSWSWQANVLLHAKYDQRGQRLKRWILALTAIQFVIVVAWVMRPW